MSAKVRNTVPYPLPPRFTVIAVGHCVAILGKPWGPLLVSTPKRRRTDNGAVPWAVATVLPSGGAQQPRSTVISLAAHSKADDWS